MYNSTLQRKTPMRRSAVPMQRSAWKNHAPKKRPGHEPRYTAACEGEPCYLNMPGCRHDPRDETVVPAHRNMGKGIGLKVHDRLTVPACHYCHTLYDQSGMDREYKRAAWDWAYTRWEPVRARKMGAT